MATQTPPDDLLPISEAAVMLHRTMRTLRVWSTRGYAPTGTTLPTYRDAVTKVRYFRRCDVQRIRAAIFRPELP